MVVCDYCGKSFKSDYGRECHIANVHGANALRRPRQVESLIKHVDYITSSQKLYQCNQCPKTFSVKSGRKAHIEAVHSKKNIKNNKDLVIMCTFCPQSFKSVIDLENHKKTFHGPSPEFKIQPNNSLLCTYCSKTFQSSLDLNQHILSNHKDNWTSININSSSSQNSEHKISLKNVICCIYCSKQFKKLEELEQHNANVHKNKDYFLCSYCSQPFSSDQGRKEHMAKVHDYISFNCQVCQKGFKREIDMIQHLKSAHDYFPCNICHVILNCIVDLRNHLKSAHASFMCHLCPKIFSKIESMVNHMNSTHQCSILACNHCIQVCPDKSSLKKHITEAHSDKKSYDCSKTFSLRDRLKTPVESVHKNKSISENKIELQKVICKYCLKVFKHEIDMIQHLKSAHNYFQCYICKAILSCTEDLQDHLKSVHKTNSINKSPLKKDIAESHSVKLSTNTKLYMCGYCSKTFSVKSDLENHESDHKNVPIEVSKIICKYCLKLFKHEIDMIQHLNSAHNYFLCNICNLLLYCNEDLQDHLKVHQTDSITHIVEDDKNVVISPNTSENDIEVLKVICKYCPKVFKQKLDLKQHLKSAHDCFLCETCDYILFTTVEYQQHLKVIHDTMMCQLCYKLFNKTEDMVNHMETIHRCYVVACNYCIEIFADEISLKEHVKEIHKNPFSLFISNTNNDNVSINREKFNSQQLQCSYCTNKFDDTLNLKQHELAKHKELDYFPCYHCDEIFGSNISRRKHHAVTHKKSTDNSSECLREEYSKETEIIDQGIEVHNQIERTKKAIQELLIAKK